ncbi:MAG: glycosyl hydrolase [Deltaproteobacteria bacterium]|nr:glycosyl hydrolase [Deltaproteobacteria bacterium]
MAWRCTAALAAGLAAGFAWIPIACFDYGDDGAPGAGGQATTTSSSSTGGPGGGGGAGAAGGAGGEAPDAGPDGEPPGLVCPTSFRFELAEPGATNPRVVGEWASFNVASATALAPKGNGVYVASVDLPPGLHACKFIYDKDGKVQWVFDPAQGRRKYFGGVENSAVKVPDCRLPTFKVDASAAARPAPGQGSFEATLSFVDGSEASGADAAGFEATLDAEGTKKTLKDPELAIDAKSGNVKLSLTKLADGKYTVRLRAKTANGRVGDSLRLVFWIEAEPFSWQDALIYMVVVDRFKDGDPANNPPATPEADPRGDWKGGDLEGLRQEIAAGTLDALGVRAIWLTPFGTNPKSAFLASDGIHKVAGYHGYWPVKAREVEPRIGGAAGLHALVKEAHAHGIRILQDYVLNHVHQEHEYVSAHPDWFRTGCVCGTPNCDWTAHALDCMFATYMPDVNHTNPAANAAFVADAVWWLDELNLDGFRIDAVKHVEEAATRNLAAEVREGFELAGARYFLMGETAMGWNDCADPCNDENYGTIAKYVGPFGLDGQLDFVLYHGVAYRTFAYSDKGMLHAGYWFEHGLQKWPAGAVMTPYLGSHDTPRFATLADYRGQDGAHDRAVPGNKWDDTAVAPGEAEPYERTRIALAWLFGLSGAPLLYYGDEYGQWGGADPNNRLMWRPAKALSADEAATLAFVRKLGKARENVPALRRGGYVGLWATEDSLAFGRPNGKGNAAIVALTRAASSVPLNVEVAKSLGLAAGTVLKDALGGPGATVSNGGYVTAEIPAKGAIVLAP